MTEEVKKAVEELQNSVSGLETSVESIKVGGLNPAQKEELDLEIAKKVEEVNSKINTINTEVDAKIETIKVEYNAKISEVEKGLVSAKETIDNTKLDLEKVKSDLVNTDLNVLNVTKTVDEVKGELTQKVDQTTFDLTEAEVERHKTLISQNAKGIELAATKEELSLANDRVSKAEANIQIQHEEILSKVSHEEVREEIEKIDKYQPNLLRNTRDWIDWVNPDNTIVKVKSDTFRMCHIVEVSANDIGLSTKSDYLEIGKTYTITVWAKAPIGSELWLDNGGAALTQMSQFDGDANLSDTWKRYKAVIVADSEILEVKFIFKKLTGIGSLSGSKMELGSKASGWQPHADDIYERTIKNETQIQQNSESIVSTVKTLEEQGDSIRENKTKIDQQDNAIKLQVENLQKVGEKTESNSSSIELMKDEITSKVSSTEVGAMISDVNLDNRNKILNSDFVRSTEKWTVAKEFKLKDVNESKMIHVERTGLKEDLSVTATSNSFPAKQGERIMFGFDFIADKANYPDRDVVASLEVLNAADVRIDFKEISLKDNYVNDGTVQRINGTHITKMADAAKARLVFVLRRNGSVSFGRAMAQFGDIKSTDWSLAPEDVDIRRIQMETEIKQTQKEIELKVSSAEMDALTEKVNTNTSNIEMTNKSIDLKVTESKEYTDTKTEEAKKYAEAKIKLETDSITQSVTSVSESLAAVEEKVNDVESKDIIIGSNKWKGGNVSAFGSRTASDIDVRARDLNINTITFPVLVKAANATSNDVVIDSVTLKEAKESIPALVNLGYNVILEPYPFIAEGTITEVNWNPTDKAKWFVSWGNALNELANLATTSKAAGMYVASNLVHMENETAKWEKAISDVRSRFKGEVLYRTNWWTTAVWDTSLMEKHKQRVENPIFGLVDKIAIAAYFEITDALTPSVKELKEGILNTPLFGRGQNIYEEVKMFNDRWKKPIFFGELGITPHKGAAKNPWSWERDEKDYDESVQANWFKAFYEVFSSLEWFQGFSIYSISDPNNQFHVQKMARDVIRPMDFGGGRLAGKIKELESTMKVMDSEIKQTSEEITSKVQKVEAKVDDLELGSRNLLVGTANFTSGRIGTIIPNDFVGNSTLSTPVPLKVFVDMYSPKTSIEATGKVYTLSFYAKADEEGVDTRCYFYSPNTTTKSINSQGYKGSAVDGASFFKLSQKWTKYWVTWEQGSTSDKKKIIVNRVFGKSTAKGNVYLSSPILVEGNKPTDWSPAPEDQTKEVTDLKYWTQTEIKQTSTTWGVKLDSLERYTNAFRSGKVLYTDPLFQEGFNGLAVYNNLENGNVTLAMTEKADNPTESPSVIEVTTKGAAHPNHGGVGWANKSRANAVYIYKLVAKIPKGRTINFSSNPTGDGTNKTWLTPTDGTDKWTEYLFMLECGSTGSFSSAGFFHISGGSVPTTTAPLKWEICFGSVTDVTSFDMTLQDLKKDVDFKLTPDGIFGEVSQSSDFHEWKENVDSKPSRSELDEAIDYAENLSDMITGEEGVLKELSRLSVESNQFKVEVGKVKADTDANSKSVSEVMSYMSFDDKTGLEIGKTDEVGMKVTISNKEMNFYDKGTSVASISGQKMIITELDISEKIKLGRHEFSKLAEQPDITIVRFVG